MLLNPEESGSVCLCARASVCMCVCARRIVSPLDRYLAVRKDMETVRQRKREEEDVMSVSEMEGAAESERP